MRLNRKLSIILLAAIMLLANVISANAATIYTEGALKYKIENESITIVEYFGIDKTVTVPASIAGTPVNTIGKGAFNNTNATKVNLPDTITSIEEGAFSEGVTVVYDNSNIGGGSNSGDSGSGSDNSGSDSGSSGGSSGTVIGGGSTSYYKNLKKGETVTIGKKKFTVVEEGQILQDEDGNEYTIDEEGNVIDPNGELYAQAYGLNEGEGTLEEKGFRTSIYKLIIVAIVLAVILAGVLLYIRKRKKAQQERW